jgi:pyrimidine-nucleoside phosphorylase
LMAVCCRGLTMRETGALTMAMARSGRILDWPGVPYVTDKHSTGGVGDKATLVVVPIVAAAGASVAKMSGRGLGHTGGTLDKLESIPGLEVRLPVEQIQRQVERIGLAIVAQTADLAPADGKMYALRDATATVQSLPLIAASVMSKKIAGGAHGIVLDVKTGKGAFATSQEEAHELGTMMLQLGQACGRRVRAVLSSMDQPLGNSVGNALEIKEVVATLTGAGASDLVSLSLVLAGQMLYLAGLAKSDEEGERIARDALDSGAAFEKLGDMVSAQGGDRRALVDTKRLPTAPIALTARAPRTGYVATLDARGVGDAVVQLGGGRQRKEDSIDPSVGVLFHARPGAFVAAGESIFEIHGQNKASAEVALASVMAAFTWSEEQPRPTPLILDVLR